MVAADADTGVTVSFTGSSSIYYISWALRDAETGTFVLEDTVVANITTNGGATWTGQDNQPTAEMYRVTVDERFPYRVYGCQQDNTCVVIPSRTTGGSIAREDWDVIGGCESGHVAVDPRDPDVTYAGFYGGSITRFDLATGEEREIMAYPELAVGQAARDLRYRYQWNAPIRISPHDPKVLYHASQFVHRSTDEGSSWQVISPDLTRDEEARQGPSGGPLTKDNTGVEVFDTVFAFEESPLEKGTLWAGSDDGLIHVSRDDGVTWVDVTPKAMPEWPRIATASATTVRMSSAPTTMARPGGS